MRRYHRDDKYTFWQRMWQHIIGGDPHGRPHMKGQTCWVWCPRCGFDLCSNPDTKVGRLHEDDSRDIVYTCGVCDLESVWDFDSFMAPAWLYNRCPILRYKQALEKIVGRYDSLGDTKDGGVAGWHIAKTALEPGFVAQMKKNCDTHKLHVTELGEEADVSS